MCSHYQQAWGCWRIVSLESYNRKYQSKVFYNSIWYMPVFSLRSIPLAIIQNSGFTKSLSPKDRLNLSVGLQNSHYPSMKKWNQGPQFGNFPSPGSVLALQCKECSGCFNITMAWQDSLRSTARSQTPSDGPCRVPPTTSLRGWREAIRNTASRESESKKHSRTSWKWLRRKKNSRWYETFTQFLQCLISNYSHVCFF